MVKGYGNIMIEWRKLDSHLPITATVKSIKSLNAVTSTLEIDQSIGYYKGNYYCTASNSAGVVNSSSAFLNISGKYIQLGSFYNTVATKSFMCLLQ